MSDDKFELLKSVTPPKPSEGARRRAAALAFEAFDDAQKNASVKKNVHATQGSEAVTRPISITAWMKGLFAMENRVPLTAALTGLLLLPIGYWLYSNTALTPLPVQPMESITLPSADTPTEVREERADAEQVDDFALADAEPMPEPSIVAPSPQPTNAVPMQKQSLAVGGAIAQMESELDAVADGYVISRDSSNGAEPVDGRFAGGDGDQFTSFENAQIKVAIDEPVSTFSIDVDKASYAYMRNAINQGWLPQADAVRVEELINYFSYDYAQPDRSDVPFSTDIEIVPSPWNDGKQLMRIGVQGYELPIAERPAANLVFLIDTSGSMNDADKLPLLISSFSMMLDALDENDTISIVTYAGSAGTVLEPTAASEKAKILQALRSLSAGGSTAGSAGIELAYDWAEKAFLDNGVNQVILATDGDFNVGLSDTNSLTDLISDKRDDGVFLSVLGFGSGNLNDGIMQALAQNGDGTAYYIDTLSEARSILVDDLAQTLVPIARDVKIQVEFNPAQVAEYRLIGYETRALNREDFNNDKVDAGDVGAGASVTAIYEITPVGSDAVLVDPLRYGTEDNANAASQSEELGYFKLRYKLPDEAESRLIEHAISPDTILASLDEADADTKFAVAVASFGQKLRNNSFVDNMSFDDIAALAAAGRGGDEDGYRAEFIKLVELAAGLDALK